MPIRTLVAAAVVVGALGLSLVGGAGAAQATNASSASSVLKYVNDYRVAHLSQRLRSNGYITDYAQEVAGVYAAQGQAAALAAKTADRPPAECSGQQLWFSHGSGSTAPTVIAKDFASRTAGSSSVAWGAVGYVVKGTTRYAVLAMTVCGSEPLDKITPGVVSFVGTPKTGEPFVASVGKFGLAGNPDGSPNLRYQWIASDADNERSWWTTEPKTTLAASDIGEKLRLYVFAAATGYNSAYNVSPLSAEVLPGPLPSPAVVGVTGARNVGETLTLSIDGWLPDGFVPHFTEQWFRDGKAITPNDDSEGTYRQVAADYGHKITVAITSSYPGYTTETKTSTTSVKTDYPLLANTAKPTITGDPTFGQTVSATPGSWAPSTSALTYTYQWYEGGKPVSGATHSTHKVGLAAATAHSLSVAVTAHESQYGATTAMSDATYAWVAKLYVKDPEIIAPAVIRVGTVLKTKPATWTTPPSTIKYQWLDNHSGPIAGAVHTTHTITAADCAHGIYVWFEEIATKAGYETAHAVTRLPFTCAD